MDANTEGQSNGSVGIAALLAWVFLTLTSGILRRTGHAGSAFSLAMAGGAAVAIWSAFVVLRRLRVTTDRKTDMDLVLCSAVLLLVGLSALVWLTMDPGLL